MAGEDDFNPQDYTNRLDNLETFKQEFEGLSFYNKVKEAIEKSKDVNDLVKNLAWESIKQKLIWILLTGVGLIIVDLVLRAIPSILAKIG